MSSVAHARREWERTRTRTPLAEKAARETRGKDLGRLKYARAAIQEAQSIESRHSRGCGGHRHDGSVSPLLTLPLPRGWCKP